MQTGPLLETQMGRFGLDVLPDLDCFDDPGSDNAWLKTNFNEEIRLLEVVRDDPGYIPDLCAKVGDMIRKGVLSESACSVCKLVDNVLCPVIASSGTVSVLVSCLKLLVLNLRLCVRVSDSVWVRCMTSKHSVVQSCFFGLVRKWLKYTKDSSIRASAMRLLSRNMEKTIDVCVGGRFFPRVYALEAIRLSCVRIPHASMQRLELARLTMTASGPGQTLAIAHAAAVLHCQFPIRLANLKLMFQCFEDPKSDVGMWGELAQRAITALQTTSCSEEGLFEQEAEMNAVMPCIARQAWRRVLSVHRKRCPNAGISSAYLFVSRPVWEAGLRFVPSLVCDFIREAGATGVLCQAQPGGLARHPVLELQSYLVRDDARAHLREFISAHVDALAIMCELAAAELEPTQCGVVTTRLELFRDTAEACTALLCLAGECGGVEPDSPSWKCRHEARAFVGLMFNFVSLQSSIDCRNPHCKCFDTKMVTILCTGVQTLHSTHAMRLDADTLLLLEGYVTSKQLSDTISRSKQLSRRSVTELAGLYENLGAQLCELGPEACLSVFKGCLGLLALAQETDPYGCFVLGPVSRKVRSCLRGMTPQMLCSVPEVCTHLASAAGRGSISRIESVWLASTLCRCQRGERLVANADGLLHNLAGPFQAATSGRLTVHEERSIAREERLFVSLFRKGGEGRKRDVCEAQLEWGLTPQSKAAKANPTTLESRR